MSPALASPHPQQPALSGNTTIVPPAQALQLFPLAPLSSILFCLVFLFSFPFRGLQLRTGRNWAWYRWLEGEDFWQEKTSRSGHLAQSEFTLGSPQLEIVSSVARVPQQHNKTLGKQQVSTRWPFWNRVKHWCSWLYHHTAASQPSLHSAAACKCHSQGVPDEQALMKHRVSAFVRRTRWGQDQCFLLRCFSCTAILQAGLEGRQRLAWHWYSLNTFKQPPFFQQLRN